MKSTKTAGAGEKTSSTPSPTDTARYTEASVQQSLSNQTMQYLLKSPRLTSPYAPPSEPLTRSQVPRVHENALSNHLLRKENKLGAALGQDIFIASNLGKAKRKQVLDHELRHTAQVNGRETNLVKPVRVGSPGDRWEKNARNNNNDIQRGADPQTLRFFGEEDVCSTETILSSSEDSITSSTDASTVSSEDLSTDTGEEINACVIENPVCEAEDTGASFDPNAIDVAGMRNDELNAESLSVDEWFNTNGDMSHRDREAYTVLRTRLKAERTLRVQNGHLWMTTATTETPDTFYMLQTGGGLTHIISVYPDIALGVPEQSFPGPIMTVQQFQDHMGGMGIPIYTEEEYFQLLQENAEGPGESSIDSGADIASIPGEIGGDSYFGPHGYLGGISMLDTRASLLAQTIPYGDPNVRAGDIGEAFGLSARDSLLATNYNSGRRGWSGDFLRPLRPMRGSDPVADFRVLYGSPFDDLSAKVTRPGTAGFTSPSSRTRFSTYLRGHVDILDTSASKFQSFASTHRPGIPLDDVSAGLGLAIPENHLADYQAFLRDPTGFDLTTRGNPSTTPNYDQAPVRAVYERTRFPAPITLPDGGAPITTGAELYAARRSGRITLPDFETHIRVLGNAAAGRVVAIPGFHTGVIPWYEGYRSSMGTTDASAMRAALNPDTLQTLELMRQRQQITNPDAPFVPGTGRVESAHVAWRNARLGGGLRAGASIAGDLIFNDEADMSSPEYREHLYRLAAIEGTAGITSEFGESYLRSQAGLAMAREGLSATAPRALAMRIGARAVPGVVDAAVEGISMWSDDRENSTEEIVVRTGRAAVIGVGSAWAGAAVGTAVGGPIGFVVGFGVGALVGWLGNSVLPGGREYWEEQERERQRVAAVERRVAELERRMEELRARRARLDTPLDSEAASVAGVEGLFGLPTSNPLFMSSSPDYVPSVGELEAEYLISTLNAGETHH